MKKIPYGMFKTPEALQDHLERNELAARVAQIPCSNSFQGQVVCSHCHDETEKKGQDPRAYSKLAIGFTLLGLQVWCRRCDSNVMHIDFEGVQHPINDKRLKEKTEQQERK